jgi:5-methylcytosine-specific restriction endonuclease McrA
VLSLDDAEGMIPRHPQCRCCWLPANVGEDPTGNRQILNRRRVMVDNDKQRSSFFADCERDEHGWCVEGEDRVSADHLEKVQALARKKADEAPVPTDEEREDALTRIAKVGANKYRRGTVGNSSDRAKRRDALLKEFGDGKECPCIYCGLKVTHGTLQQDKICTSDEGGKYRLSNLVPACVSCNTRRGDTAWSKIKWGKKVEEK